MNSQVEINHSERSLASIFGEMKVELKEFVETRTEILKSEFRDKITHWKVAAPLAGLGVVLLCTAYLLFTLALVGLAAVFIGDTPYRWFFAFCERGRTLGNIGRCLHLHCKARIRAESIDAAEDP